MKLTRRGKNTSDVEVTNISAHGFWLLLQNREHFVPFDENPWFKDATVRQILHVRLLRGHHLHWPDLDVDLEIDALSDPARYPLIYS